jgi:hypothetical protein
MVFDKSAHDSGSAFRAQRQPAVTAVYEGIHLLSYDIGSFTDAADEELLAFQQRRAYLFTAIEMGDLARYTFDMLP